MDIITSFSRRIWHSSAACLLLAAFFVSAGVSHVQAGEGVSFSWRANPVEDEIVGYRLYYGQESRLAASSYEYYIDFTSWERCPAGQDGFGCEPLPADAVTCQDLFLETPTCTVFDLQDRLYFAMTAYNAIAESDYTQEVSVLIDKNGNQIPVARLAVLQQVYSLLLR